MLLSPSRRQAWPPTHQIIKEARESGFSNVHDYLVHQATGAMLTPIPAGSDQVLRADQLRDWVLSLACISVAGSRQLAHSPV